MGKTFEPVLLNVRASFPFTYFEEPAFTILPDAPIVAVLVPVVRSPLVKSRMPFTVIPASVSVSPPLLSSVRLLKVVAPVPVMTCAVELAKVTLLPVAPLRVPLFCKFPPILR